MRLSSIKETEAARVVFRRRNLSGRLTVFFGNRATAGFAPGPESWAGFSGRCQLNTVVIQPFAPHWYQGRAAAGIRDILKDVMAEYDHTTLAGIGMGAYGALHAAQYLNVDEVIAVRPISSLDPLKVPAGPARSAEHVRLGRPLEPILTHRARRYTIFASRGGDQAQLRRLYLPMGRTRVFPLALCDGSGPLRLPEDLLLTLLEPPYRLVQLAATA